MRIQPGTTTSEHPGGACALLASGCALRLDLEQATLLGGGLELSLGLDLGQERWRRIGALPGEELLDSDGLNLREGRAVPRPLVQPRVLRRVLHPSRRFLQRYEHAHLCALRPRAVSLGRSGRRQPSE